MASAATQASSLWDALVSVPDHRRAAGRRYPLASLLLIAIAALLAGRRDQLSIVRWGRRLNLETLASIGINRARVPAPSVWCEVFKGLDVTALERALGGWVRGDQTAGHVAIDGKRLRGSATAQSSGVHLLAAFSVSLQGVIGQLAVAPDTNEITAALQLLKTLPLDGVIITGDAIFTQKEICRAITDGGGDYFFTVKNNQPALKADIGFLRAGFPPVRPGHRRLTCVQPQRSRRAMAGSRRVGWRLPQRWPSIWRHPGLVWRRSAASPASVSCAAKPVSRRSMPSPAWPPMRLDRLACSNCHVSIGGSRTSCTTFAMSPAARIRGEPTPEMPRRCSPPCATQC